MNSSIIATVLFVYFILILLVARITGKQGGSRNSDFFLSGRKSPWYAVAFGMIGASISGVSFVSVTGWVESTDMTYLQMCMGFIVGYVIVAFVLLPIYYRMHSASIYSFLGERLGTRSYKTGAAFFFLSKITGASARLYVACLLLHELVFRQLGISFIMTAALILLLIWSYTRKNGIRTLVWTDTLQTAFMLTALVAIIVNVAIQLGFNFTDTVSAITANEHYRIFEFGDWTSRQHFAKQFLSGVFIVIVMTGLDQDMMQKNLTCRTLKDAQKDMCTYGTMFLPVNFLLLALGILLLLFCQKYSIALPDKSDHLLPMLCSSGALGTVATLLLSVGVMAAAFSSADSALTALTTSFCIDFLDIRKHRDPEHTRSLVHAAICGTFLAFILLFEIANNSNVIDAIYTIASYTYGPLLGMFAFGIFSHRKACDRAVPYIAVASPLACYALSILAAELAGYSFGYELLLLNGLITYLGLHLSSFRHEEQSS
ncbi:MAG: sodium:solute symporter [Bacteroidaceae bacterium]|nr:sodium:solute symporter [Bacteroidaceae bacterium]